MYILVCKYRNTLTLRPANRHADLADFIIVLTDRLRSIQTRVLLYTIFCVVTPLYVRTYNLNISLLYQVYS